MSRLCNFLVTSMFPSGKLALEDTLNQIDDDLTKLYEDLKEKQIRAHELKESLTKLNDKKIAMAPNAMSRESAISQTKKKLIMTLSNVKKIRQQIEVFEGTKSTIENSQMASEMAARIDTLRKRIGNVTTINTKNLEEDIDTIQEANEHVERVNNTINDTMISAWSMEDYEADELLEEFLAQDDDTELLENARKEKLLAQLEKEKEEKERKSKSALNVVTQMMTRKTTPEREAILDSF